jgi:hypothetical protein
MSIIDREKSLQQNRDVAPGFVVTDTFVESPRTKRREFYVIEEHHSFRRALDRLKAAELAGANG